MARLSSARVVEKFRAAVWKARDPGAVDSSWWDHFGYLEPKEIPILS